MTGEGTWSYKLNQYGNAFVIRSSANTELYSGRNEQYYEYILTINATKNPNAGFSRSADTSFDKVYIDPNLNDDLTLWSQYDEYTYKFEMAMLDDTNQPGLEKSYNRAYGVLNNAWLGLKPLRKLLYVLD